MLDVQFIRENRELVKEASKNKGVPDRVDELLSIDEKRKELLQKVQELRTERNQLNEKSKGNVTQEIIEKGKKLKEKISSLEKELSGIQGEYDSLMLQIPNMPSEDVPIGDSEEDNKEVAQWGEKPEFDFEYKNHFELAKDLDIVDFERGTKVAGFRGYYLKGEGALLHLAVMNFALKKLIQKDFTPVIPPIILNERPFINSAHFPWGKVDVYKTYDDQEEKDERFLAGTAEVPLVSYHMDEVFEEKDLPKLYAGYSPCYRREIGSYGKDTQGMYRIHEFTKVEQVVICKNDMSESEKWLENLRDYSEEMLQDLGLHYRVMLMCTGDMGEPQVKKYDIETWMPGRQDYGETMSDSIVGDFQSRRANIRYKTKEGSMEYVHLLNNTAIASPRILIAILESYQQKDGSVVVPEVLRDYVGKDVITPK